MPSVTLNGRAFLRLSGKDAETFLQALVTTDLPSMPEGEIRPGALLTPQGKILFSFLIRRDGPDAFLMETTADQRDGFVKRLTLYTLRAAVEIAVVEGALATVAWEEPEAGAPLDARFAKAGLSVSRRPGGGGDADEADYDRLRIAHGIVEAGRDYALSDAFPHDVLLDLSDGLSFRKGCYVGQEVVSRMQHRSTARRRPAIVTGAAALPPSGTEILAGGKPAGMLGTVCGEHGVAIVRIDRVGDALASGVPLSAGGVAVSLALPGWTGLAFAQDAAEEASAP